MSRERFILNNNLRGINSNITNLNDNLQNLHSKLGNIDYEIDNISDKQEALDGRMNTLSGILNDFIEANKQNTELQLAETRQGNLKQDLQNKFGYYDEIRRMVLGILQGVDSGVVSHETLKNASETLLIKTPDYWIAPALVAIVAWIRNDKEDTEKALKEALRRDDYKTTLFFMLIMRRLERHDACYQWMQRYLQHQDPYNLEREFVTILEAAATGSFPPTSRQLMMSTVNGWIDQLSQEDQYFNEQKAEWLKFFQNKGSLSSNKYPLLEKYCTNWSELTSSMRKVRLHEFLDDYFKNIFNSGNDAKSSKDQLDDILTLLINNFDDEELELKKEIEHNQKIIRDNGKKKSSASSYSSQNKAFQAKTDFLQMLTNAATNPELLGLSKATQTLAVAFSKPWIIEAHDTYTAEYRMNFPANADLDIEGFKTSSSNGSDETEQLKAHDEHWDKKLKEEVKKSSSGNGCMIMLPIPFIVLAIFIFKNGAHVLSYVFFAICFAFLLFTFLGSTLNKNDVKKKNKESRKNSQEVLRGCLAELVDFRKEYSLEDAKAEEIRSMLQSISAENFAGKSRDVRTIL